MSGGIDDDANAAKPKKPPGWYGREQREERRRLLHERREQRKRQLEVRRSLAEAQRVRQEARAETAARWIAEECTARVARAPRLVHGIMPLPNESDAMYQSRVNGLKLASERARMNKRWDHKAEGTAETHEYASKTRQGALARLYMKGQIDAGQLGCACEIAAVAEAIERDVEVRGMSYEMRVDYSGSGRDVLVEGIMRVRREVAYGWWRQRIRDPKRAVLDMLVGEPLSYSAVAINYRMGKARAFGLLIHALDLWPDAMRYAEREIDEATLAAAHAGILGG